MSTITNRRESYKTDGEHGVVETIVITPCIHDVAIHDNLVFDRTLAEREEAA